MWNPTLQFLLQHLFLAFKENCWPATFLGSWCRGGGGLKGTLGKPGRGKIGQSGDRGNWPGENRKFPNPIRKGEVLGRQ